MVRVAFGEWDTVNLEGRWAGELGNGWYARAVGGVRRSDGFAVSRVGGPSTASRVTPERSATVFLAEVVPIDGEDTQIFFGGIRLDKYLSEQSTDHDRGRPRAREIRRLPGRRSTGAVDR